MLKYRIRIESKNEQTLYVPQVRLYFFFWFSLVQGVSTVYPAINYSPSAHNVTNARRMINDYEKQSKKREKNREFRYIIVK